MFVVNCLHFLAFVIWAGTVKLQFDNCTHDVPYTGTKSVCGMGGSVISLWNAFFLFFCSIGFCCVARKLRQEENNENNQNKPNTTEYLSSNLG